VPRQGKQNRPRTGRGREVHYTSTLTGLHAMCGLCGDAAWRCVDRQLTPPKPKMTMHLGLGHALRQAACADPLKGTHVATCGLTQPPLLLPAAGRCCRRRHQHRVLPFQLLQLDLLVTVFGLSPAAQHGKSTAHSTSAALAGIHATRLVRLTAQRAACQGMDLWQQGRHAGRQRGNPIESARGRAARTPAHTVCNCGSTKRPCAQACTCMCARTHAHTCAHTHTHTAHGANRQAWVHAALATSTCGNALGGCTPAVQGGYRRWSSKPRSAGWE
jgi:hypothetical protein